MPQTMPDHPEMDALGFLTSEQGTQVSPRQAWRGLFRQSLPPAAQPTSLLLPLLPNFPPTPASLIAQSVRNLPSMQTRVRSLGQEDSLEKEMATHSSILAWKIPWTEEPGRLQSMGSKQSDTT